MPTSVPQPRLVIAGVSGDSGKTLVSLGLILAARARGLTVRAFKKGPDYIDAAWLGWASGAPARNLDTYLMGFPAALASFSAHATGELNVVEGNRGLYDGVDAQGTHSTAELAKTLGAPVVLVVDATKVTRTAAATVLGCQHLDPAVRIAGVILNRVSGARHERILRDAIASVCGIPVLGVLPKLAGERLLPGRHLGLVPPEEHPSVDAQSFAAMTEGRLDIEGLLAVAATAPSRSRLGNAIVPSRDREGAVRIAYVRDSAFTFYYPENLEALEQGGAELLPVSALGGVFPEDADALYIGGGFPETHAPQISANSAFLHALTQTRIPIYAECGGLMLLARAIHWQGTRYPMSGVLPFDVEVRATPQGHGYTHLEVDRENPFFPLGLHLQGHEFHYSRIVPEGDPPPAACAVTRGAGCYHGRDGITVGNVWATYTHLHALATPEWAAGLLRAARRYALARTGES